MALIKTIDIDQKSRLYVWDVQEPLATLQEGVSLTPQQNEMFQAIHNEKVRKIFQQQDFCLKIQVIPLQHYFMTLMANPS